MADRRTKTTKTTKTTKKTVLPKPIRPPPSPKLVIPFTSSDYNVPNQADSSDDEENVNEDKTQANESPPSLPPTPAPPEHMDDAKQGGSADHGHCEASTATQNVNVDLDSTQSSSEDNRKSSRRAKVIYNLSPLHYRPIGWGFIKISVVGLCFSALIGIVFAILSTKHSLDLKNEVFKYGSQNDFTGRMAMRSGNVSISASTCLRDPPVGNCMVWDWDKETREKGTVVIYQCSDKVQSLAMIVICDYESRNWKVVKNVTNNCAC